MKNEFTWVPLYKELASALLRYKDDRTPLVKWIYEDLGKVTRNNGKSLVAYIKKKDGSRVDDIDPFSVFAIFNRGASWAKRTEFLIRFKSHFALSSEIPTDFNGIPIVDARRAFFFSWEDNNDIVIRDLWILFEKVVKGETIEAAFNQVLENGMPKFSLTMCLFWVRPDSYLALDSRNRSYLEAFDLPNDYSIFNYHEYSTLLEQVRQKMNAGVINCKSFVDISYSAWKAGNETAPKAENTGKRYWMFSPGENASQWELCKKEGIISINWSELGNFSQYSSIDEIKTRMQDVYKKTDTSFMNDRLAVWDFYSTIKPGDIVFAKKGRRKIIGRGVVTGDYYFDSNREKHPNLRTVKWEFVGEWDSPHESPTKTLTDITNYPDYVSSLEALFYSKAKRYWWLVANPSIWSMSDMKSGEEVDYSLFNEKGNKRRIFQNFIDAKVGDQVIGYEGSPTQQIVALLEVTKENDGKNIWFKKIKTFKTPVELSSLKKKSELKDLEFFINPNGSFFKLTEVEYNHIMRYVQEDDPLPVSVYLPYTKIDFLNEVYVSEEDFETMKSLLLRKKNLILQGAPGVGKTYAARRLAYAIMGEKDDSHIEQVQFHQSYSYEDFMMGYKPNDKGGFEMNTGVFYNFCKKAAADADSGKPYFFIIDEINRGNLSKIFGELLMLIENDYRGRPIKLPYRDEEFSVPSNIHIIGMMNTADRSLAMIDYALRRRFSFYEMKPGFDSKGFTDYMLKFGNPKFFKVVEAVKGLNQRITDDASLGSGFCIGHSYFCELEGKKNLPLSEIVEYDIIPMLREYWFDNEDAYKEEARRLREAAK